MGPGAARGSRAVDGRRAGMGKGQAAKGAAERQPDIREKGVKEGGSVVE